MLMMKAVFTERHKLLASHNVHAQCTVILMCCDLKLMNSPHEASAVLM